MLSHGFCGDDRPQEKEVVFRQILAEFVFGKQVFVINTSTYKLSHSFRLRGEECGLKVCGTSQALVAAGLIVSR